MIFLRNVAIKSLVVFAIVSILIGCTVPVVAAPSTGTILNAKTGGLSLARLSGTNGARSVCIVGFERQPNYKYDWYSACIKRDDLLTSFYNLISTNPEKVSDFLKKLPPRPQNSAEKALVQRILNAHAPTWRVKNNPSSKKNTRPVYDHYTTKQIDRIKAGTKCGIRYKKDKPVYWREVKGIKGKTGHTVCEYK